MKKFLVDQVLFLIAGIVIMIFVPVFCGPIFTLIFEILVILFWGYLCRRILLLPLDFILGKASQKVYFASQCGIETLEFFKDTSYYIWKFYHGRDQTIKVFVPIPIINGEAVKISLPPKDVKIKVIYYRLSKILLQWELD